MDFKQALTGAKRTIAALETAAQTRSRLSEAISLESQSKSDRDTQRKLLDEQLAHLRLSEKEGRMAVTLGEELARKGWNAESVARRWPGITFVLSKESNVLSLSKLWNERSTLNRELEEDNLELGRLRSAVEWCLGLEDSLRQKEQQNAEIDEKQRHANSKGVFDRVWTYLANWKNSPDELQSLQKQIRMLDRPGTEKQIVFAKNRKDALNASINKNMLAIQRILVELSLPNNSDVEQMLPVLQADLELGHLIPTQFVSALKWYSSLSACINQWDEADRQHLQAKTKRAETVQQDIGLKAECTKLLAEDWLTHVINSGNELFGLGTNPSKLLYPSFKLLRTEDHPQVLEDAITGAKERLIIISPWPGAGARRIVSLLEEAMGRGVQVWIGCGLADQNGDGGPDSEQEKRKRERSRDTLRGLRELQRKNRLLILVDNYRSHEKLIIRDDNLFVCGSYNWLSFVAGERSRFETSILLDDSLESNKKQIAEIMKQYIERLEMPAKQTQGD